MKVSLTIPEAKAVIATSFNRERPSPFDSICTEDISITDLVGQPAVLSPEEGGILTGDRRLLDRRETARQIEALIRATGRESNGFRDKIGMIKAVRSLTGLGLKEAKDLVENSLVPF